MSDEGESRSNIKGSDPPPSLDSWILSGSSSIGSCRLTSSNCSNSNINSVNSSSSSTGQNGITATSTTSILRNSSGRGGSAGRSSKLKNPNNDHSSRRHKELKSSHGNPGSSLNRRNPSSKMYGSVSCTQERYFLSVIKNWVEAILCFFEELSTVSIGFLRRNQKFQRIPKRYHYLTVLFSLISLVGYVTLCNQSGLASTSGNLLHDSSKTSMRKLKEDSTRSISSESELIDDISQGTRRAADLADGTIFLEPAHTRMCRTILSRLNQFDAGTTSFEEVIFTESEYVCRDLFAPYSSLMNMMASQLLDAVSDAIGLNVRYTHRCAKWERVNSGNRTTIQFSMPDPLNLKSYPFQKELADASKLRSVCSNCLASGSKEADCLLFPNGYINTQTNTCDTDGYFRQVLPWVRNNLRILAANWLNTVESRALTFWIRDAEIFSHREKDDMEVSVIALSCANEDCDMPSESCLCKFEPLPNWVYAMHVPRSSTNIYILITPTCAKFGDVCMSHAEEVYHFLKSLYPRTDVMYSVVYSTSSWYMRLITADHLICPPGVGCVLPAIARDAYTYVYEKTKPTVGTWLTCSPDDYLARMTLPIFPPVFVQGDCRHLRGRIGTWVQDLSLAPSLQYTNPVDGYLGCADSHFSSTADLPFRSPTIHRWDETLWVTCPVNLASKTEMCTQMDRLGLKRILFVGDHTSMTQAISLASILGQNSDISLNTQVIPNFTKTISCAGTTTISSFELSYVRNDRLEEPGTTPSPGNPNCGASNLKYCYPWSKNFAQYTGKQLLIVNTGYHWADDWQGYISNFQNFVGRIDEIAAENNIRTKDVIMFRTSIPGHRECDLHNDVYLNYDEYIPFRVNGAFWHWWGELPPYNDYTIRVINEWNLLNVVKSGPNIELLDPYFMTVLRPDGHLSGSDAGPSCSWESQECMLYSLPGPVDWWNHLLVTQLKDVATQAENDSVIMSW